MAPSIVASTIVGVLEKDSWSQEVSGEENGKIKNGTHKRENSKTRLKVPRRPVMNEKQYIQTLAAAARNDAPPTVDVTADVMARIQAQPRRRRGNILMWTYAAVTAVAATFVAAWAAHLLLLQDNASLDLIGPVMGALP